MKNYSLTDYEPYSKVSKKYNSLKDRYDKHIIPDTKTLKQEYESATNAVLIAEAAELIGDAVDKKELDKLRKQAGEVEKKLQKAEQEAEKLEYEKKVMEAGLKKLEQDMAEQKAVAIKWIAKTARADHERMMEEVLQAARKLSDIWQEDRLMKINLNKLNVRVDLADIQNRLDPGSENDASGSPLYYFVKELEKRGYKV